MTLPDLEQLDKIIALCRKRGVKSIKIDNVELTLGETVPAKRPYKKKTIKASSEEEANIAPDIYETDEPTELDLLFYSAGGVPDDIRGS